MKKDALEYYNTIEVLYEIVKCLKGRETSFAYADKSRSPIRCIKAHNIEFLKSNFNAFKFYENNFLIWNSLALLDNMPMFSYNSVKRAEQQKYFIKDFKNHFVGYDLSVDFDGDDIYKNKRKMKDFKIELISFYNLLQDYKVPFYTKPSSKNGFHFVIPNEFLDYVEEKPQNKMKISSMLSSKLCTMYDSDFIDKSIFDYRRPWKTAYSIDINSNIVSLPLNKQQFEDILKPKNDFDFSCCEPIHVIKEGVRNRGLMIQNNDHNGKNNFKEFVDNFFYDSVDVL